MLLPTADTLTRELAEVRRRVNDLESGRRLGNSSISQGALIARDAAGTERARFGQLDDGSFGVTGRVVGADITGSDISGAALSGGTVAGAVITGGSLVTQSLTIVDGSGKELPLVDALFGQKAGKNTGALTFGASGSNAANAWYYDTALNQAVTVSAGGRLDVTVTARLEVSNGVGDLEAGFRVTGPTSVAASRTDALACNYQGYGMSMVVQASYRTLVTGLAAGAYTVCPAYYLGSIGSPAAAGIVSNRAIVALPY